MMVLLVAALAFSIVEAISIWTANRKRLPLGGWGMWLLFRIVIALMLIWLVQTIGNDFASGPDSTNQSDLDAFDAELRATMFGIGVLVMLALAQSAITLASTIRKLGKRPNLAK